MKLIEKVSVREIKGDSCEVQHYKPPALEVAEGGAIPNMAHLCTLEIVQGRYFYLPGGKEVCIGMTKEVQETIGVCFDTLESMSRINQKLIQDNMDLISASNKVQGKLSSLENRSWIRKLLDLFMGSQSKEKI